MTYQLPVWKTCIKHAGFACLCQTCQEIATENARKHNERWSRLQSHLRDFWTDTYNREDKMWMATRYGGFEEKPSEEEED